MPKSALFAAIVATAGLVAVASSAASAQCSPGYQPVKVQGNWVCRIKTPKLPMKAQTQGKKSIWIPMEAPVLTSPDGRKYR
jgi:hypothetical protein